MNEDNNNGFRLKLEGTITSNDAGDIIIAKYVHASFNQNYGASENEGLSFVFDHELRTIVETFIIEKNARYNGALKLFKVIRYPEYSKNYNDLFTVIRAIQNRRLNINVMYDPLEIKHIAKIYDIKGSGVSPIMALRNAVINWIQYNTKTTDLFDSFEKDQGELQMMSEILQDEY